jgi:predicted nuclease of predicted toxin-antitoxin system
MRLLFDENLAPSLVGLLAHVYPGSENVLGVGLGGKSDAEVLSYAMVGGMAVVTKDADFIDMAMSSGTGPKVIRIALGNCTSEAIHLLLRNTAVAVHRFMESDDLVLEVP